MAVLCVFPAPEVSFAGEVRRLGHTPPELLTMQPQPTIVLIEGEYLPRDLPGVLVGMGAAVKTTWSSGLRDTLEQLAADLVVCSDPSHMPQLKRAMGESGSDLPLLLISDWDLKRANRTMASGLVDDIIPDYLPTEDIARRLHTLACRQARGMPLHSTQPPPAASLQSTPAAAPRGDGRPVLRAVPRRELTPPVGAGAPSSWPPNQAPSQPPSQLSGVRPSPIPAPPPLPRDHASSPWSAPSSITGAARELSATQPSTPQRSDLPPAGPVKRSASATRRVQRTLTPPPFPGPQGASPPGRAETLRPPPSPSAVPASSPPSRLPPPTGVSGAAAERNPARSSSELTGPNRAEATGPSGPSQETSAPRRAERSAVIPARSSPPPPPRRSAPPGEGTTSSVRPPPPVRSSQGSAHPGARAEHQLAAIGRRTSDGSAPAAFPPPARMPSPSALSPWAQSQPPLAPSGVGVAPPGFAGHAGFAARTMSVPPPLSAQALSAQALSAPPFPLGRPSGVASTAVAAQAYPRSTAPPARFPQPVTQSGISTRTRRTRRSSTLTLVAMAIGGGTALGAGFLAARTLEDQAWRERASAMAEAAGQVPRRLLPRRWLPSDWRPPAWLPEPLGAAATPPPASPASSAQAMPQRTRDAGPSAATAATPVGSSVPPGSREDPRPGTRTAEPSGTPEGALALSDLAGSEADPSSGLTELEARNLFLVADTREPDCVTVLGDWQPELPLIEAERPDRALRHKRLAQHHLMTGNEANARTELCKSAHLDPAGPGAEMLGGLYLSQHSLENAETIVRRLLEDNPESETGRELLGDVLNQQGDVQGSRRVWLRLLDVDDDETGVQRELARRWVGHAVTALKARDVPRAERLLRRALTLDPMNVSGAYLLAKVLDRQGQSALSQAWSTRAREID